MGLTLEEIQGQVASWSKSQFAANTPLEPLEGICEELGELAHSRLKRRQGIRHAPEECVAMERDAIGDMGIYLCDFAARMGCRLTLGSVHLAEVSGGDAAAFGRLAFQAGNLAALYHADHPRLDWANQCSRVCGYLSLYAKARGWDFLDILGETWARVGKRDWRKDPIAAGGTA